MGKWTSQYTDDILSFKMRELICASIERVKHDGGPPISYESFVQELTQGDMFCSKMVDLLVMELADRRHRLRPSDKRSISSRTAAGLHSLGSATPGNKDVTYSREYRRAWHHPPSHGTNGNVSFLTADEARLVSDDDDDIMDPLVGDVEGARLGTELYDSYSSHFNFPLGPHSNMSRLFSRPSPPPDESTSDEQLPSYAFLNGRNITTEGGNRWSRSFGVPQTGNDAPGRSRSNPTLEGSSELMRRPSIRRREFGDWSARRRNYTRNPSLHNDHISITGGRTTSPIPDMPSFWTEQTDRGVTNLPSPGVLSRRTLRRSAGDSNSADLHSGTSRLRPFSGYAFSTSSSASSSMPRLRRGGLPPPEMYSFTMGSRQVSETITEDSTPIPGLDIMDRLSPSPQSVLPWNMASGSEAIGLPTPRSTSPEENARPEAP